MNLALVQPWCSIGSDGSALAIEGPLRRGHPHPRSFGTFPRILGEYVRNRGLLRLEDAVRKMTSLNAAKAGLLDRGLLRPGPVRRRRGLRPRDRDRSRHLPRAVPVQHGNHPRAGQRQACARKRPTGYVGARPGARPASRPVVIEPACNKTSRPRQIKNRPENGSQTTTSPLVVQNPIDWPVGRE